MDVKILPGKYVLAVSGGVDSMTLMDILSGKPEIEVIVAYLNHGMRENASDDEALVTKAAKNYKLRIEVGKVNLGKDASEDKARAARYNFLNKVKDKHRADAIITAHHQDDLIETAIINIFRGTGPRGLVSMIENEKIIRPMLHLSKTQITEYAEENKITWLEDNTNSDTKYLRNYVRKKVIPKLDFSGKQKILRSISEISATHHQTEDLVRLLADGVMKNGEISRLEFITLPVEVGHELLVFWLRDMGVKDFDKKTVTRLYMALKTAKSGTRHDVINGVYLQVLQKTAVFTSNR